MRLKLIFVCISAVVGMHAKCQLGVIQEKLKDQQDIIFDTSGKMISFPGSFVTENTEFRFQVKAPRNIYHPWITLLKLNLKEAKKNLNLAEVQDAFACLFQEHEEYASFENALEAMLALPDSCNKGRLTGAINEEANKFIPVSSLIANIDRQYYVKVYKNEICVDSMWLEPSDNCAAGCNVFSSKSYDRIKDCKSCTAAGSGQIRFELIYIDPWNKTIRDWHTEKSIAFIEAANLSFPFIMEALDSLASSTVTPDNFAQAIGDISPFMQSWFINWFWFNGGTLQVDPFSVLARAGKKGLIADIAAKDVEIANLKEKNVFLDTAKKYAGKTINDLTKLDEIQVKQREISKAIEKAINEKTSLQRLLKGDPFLSKVGSNTIAYEGRFQPSKSFFAFSKRSVNPHKQFDAFNNFHPIKLSGINKQKITEVPENETVYIAVHNVPKAIKVNIEEKALAFIDQEEFTTLVSDQLSKIDFSSFPTANVRNLEDFVRSFGEPGAEKVGPKGATQDPVECKKRLQPYVKGFSEAIEKGYITFPPDTTLFDEIALIGPLFRTQLDPLTTFEAPYRDSLTIKAIFSPDSTVNVAKSYVKVGKLRFIQLAAGIGIANKPVSVTKIDTVGNGFQVSSSDNRAKAIFGFKVYPFRNFNRDHGLIPRYPLRRFSIMGSFELLHPLNNFYLGGAYDIIPGLAFSAGANFYLETRYRVENNVIVSTSRSYKKSGTYYAVVVNPVLFVQFVKLFFK